MVHAPNTPAPTTTASWLLRSLTFALSCPEAGFCPAAPVAMLAPRVLMKLRRSILTILIPSGERLNDLGTAGTHCDKSLAITKTRSGSSLCADKERLRNNEVCGEKGHLCLFGHASPAHTSFADRARMPADYAAMKARTARDPGQPSCRPAPRTGAPPSHGISMSRSP